MTDQDEIVARVFDELADIAETWPADMPAPQAFRARAQALRSPPRQSEGGLELFVERRSTVEWEHGPMVEVDMVRIPEAAAVIEAARNLLKYVGAIVAADPAESRLTVILGDGIRHEAAKTVVAIGATISALDKRLNPKVES